MREITKINSLRINFFAVVVMLAAIIFTGCARSVVSIGDKNINEVVASQKVFQNKINVYKDEMVSLYKKNFYFETIAANSQDSATKWQYYSKIAENDSVINVIKQKINFLEDQGDEFIVRAAGKDKVESINLYGGDPYELAEAYALVKYSNESSANNPSSGSAGLTGIIENATYRKSVLATVSGPANFYREFLLGPYEKSPEFKMPMPGSYKVVFVDGYERTFVIKSVGPNVVYYDNDKTYNFKATLLR